MISFPYMTYAETFEEIFGERDACYLMTDPQGKVIDSYNERLCSVRRPPCSTYKIPLVAMAFDSGFFKTMSTSIPWDGKKRSRSSLNQDQTPKSFIDNSVIWISQRITKSLGAAEVQLYAQDFSYGNRDSSGDLSNFWLSAGSIRISAKEQIDFLRRLWQGKTELSQSSLDLTKKSIAARLSRQDEMIYGKTGTCCIDRDCMRRPGREFGWFVGVREKKSKTQFFAINFAEKRHFKGYAGPQAKAMAQRLFKKTDQKHQE